MLHDLLELHQAAPLPDLELLVASSDFALVESRNEDGGITPLFKMSSAKTAYELVLPGDPKYLYR